MVAYTLLLFVVGLWPFNFNQPNLVTISAEGGLVLSRPGSVYTAAPSEKLHNLNQFTIYIDLTTSSNGMSAFERIFSYAINHKDLNFIVGQWKDGCSFHLPDEKNQRVIHFGADDLLKKEERVVLVIGYDGMKLSMYQDGKVRKYRETGSLSFTGWSQEYPLVIGTDADGKAQWRGHIYEASIYDRSLSPAEVARLSDPNGRKGTRDEGVGTGAAERQGKPADSRQPTVDSQKKRSQQQQTTKQENPPVSPIGRSAAVTSDQWPVNSKDQGRKDEIATQPSAARNDTPRRDSDRSQEVKEVVEGQKPLIHYVFRPENTYETSFRGGKALGVRDLGKGEPADLVVPEQFIPYMRTYLTWDPDWLEYKSNWLDLAVNILGFVPFGILLMLAFRKGLRSVKCYMLSEDGEKKSKGEIAAGLTPLAMTDGRVEWTKTTAIGNVIVAVVLSVVLGFAVSFAIEFIQAYLPSRDSSLRDLVANTAGTLIGALAAFWLVSRRKSQLC